VIRRRLASESVGVAGCRGFTCEDRLSSRPSTQRSSQVKPLHPDTPTLSLAKRLRITKLAPTPTLRKPLTLINQDYRLDEFRATMNRAAGIGVSAAPGIVKDTINGLTVRTVAGRGLVESGIRSTAAEAADPWSHRRCSSSNNRSSLSSGRLAWSSSGRRRW